MIYDRLYNGFLYLASFSWHIDPFCASTGLDSTFRRNDNRTVTPEKSGVYTSYIRIPACAGMTK